MISSKKSYLSHLDYHCTTSPQLPLQLLTETILLSTNTEQHHIRKRPPLKRHLQLHKTSLYFHFLCEEPHWIMSTRLQEQASTQPHQGSLPALRSHNDKVSCIIQIKYYFKAKLKHASTTHT